MPGNALPNSSTVRPDPTTGARNSAPWQTWQRQSVVIRPHHVQSSCRSAAERRNRSGPWQVAQRAGVRQRWQASTGKYPALGTCTNTGPAARPVRIVSKASAGNRLCLARGSRSNA